MVRLLLLLSVLFAGTAGARTVGPDEARLEAIIAPMDHKPMEQEMILLTIRGTYAVPITLERLVNPEFEDFGWMQLGRDRWSDRMIGGRKVRVFERGMALFAKKRGKLPIGSFSHRLTLLGQDGKRFEHEARSAPLTIDVARKPEGAAWWLPARAVAITDSWSTPPDALAFGGSTQRVIALKAVGAGPEMLPPAPRMQGRGLIAFPDPEDRGVELTPEGPIATVTWRWTVRMLSPDTGPLETAPIEWFDTVARAPRKIAIAPQRVALASTAAPPPAVERSGWQGYRIPMGLMAGLLLGLTIVLPGWRLKPWAEIAAPLRRRPRRAAMRQMFAAARNGDAATMWRMARSIKSPAVDELSEVVFGRAPVGDLRILARRIASAK